MKVLDYKDFAAFDYNQTGNIGLLGDIVTNEHKEIGVIIQVYDNEDVRTDMFGNCCMSEIRLATMEEIQEFQPDILSLIHISEPTRRLRGSRMPSSA